MTSPVSIYNRNEADQSFGLNSVMGRMITAAIQTNRLVDVQGFSALTQSQISCAGATNTIFFRPFDVYDSPFKVEMDGVSYGQGSGSVYMFIRADPVLSQILDADSDGSLEVFNKTPVEHRVKITFMEPYPAIDEIAIDANEDNSAFNIEVIGEHVESISFCLAPVEPIGPLPQG